MKGSRFITHLKMLKNIEEPLHNFFEVIEPLQEKLGPILFQLPPGMKKDIPLLRNFIEQLPEGYRYVFEFRNNSWYGEDLLRLLDDTGAAFCIHDLPGKVSPLAVTGAFAYVRFHGALQAYSSSYSDEELETWAMKLKDYSNRGMDVFAYFNNDMGGFAVKNAAALKHVLKIPGGNT